MLINNEENTSLKKEILLDTHHTGEVFKKHSTGPGMVVHACNPRYSGGGGRRITVLEYLGKVSLRSYLKNKLKVKWLGVWLKWFVSDKHKVLSSIPSTEGEGKIIPYIERWLHQ
jgi:hypothetical protein